jgi:hypothetical protein
MKHIATFPPQGTRGGAVEDNNIAAPPSLLAQTTALVDSFRLRKGLSP